MHHTIRLAVLVPAASMIVPWAAAIAQQPPASASLEQTLSTEYPAGTVLVVQKSGIVGSLGCPILPVSDYKERQLHRPGKMQEVALKAALCALRDFPIGWKVTLGSVQVTPKNGKVTLHLVECDACNSPAASASFRSMVEFQFGKGSLDTTDPAAVREAIGHVFTVSAPPAVPAVPVVSTDTAAPGPPPQELPPQSPPPPPTVGPIYVGAQTATNRLLLNADGSFLLLQNGQTATGTYSLSGSVLQVHNAQLNTDTDMTVDGGQLVGSGGETWVQPDQQAAQPERQTAPAAQPQPAEPPTVRAGDTPDQVKLKLGPPQKIMDLGSKVIYLYKDLKITFIGGKVADIE